MKKILIVTICFTILFCGCKQKTEHENELNSISFNLPIDSVKHCMEEANLLLDKMDYGNGASCFWKNGKFYYSHKGKGFKVTDLNENLLQTPVFKSLGNVDSKRLLELYKVLSENGISSMHKDILGNYYSFLYKQNLNPYNDHKKSRTLLFLTEKTDTSARYFQDHIVLDSYENILLLATKDYKKPKLSMDRESIMKRTEELMKKHQEKE